MLPIRGRHNMKYLQNRYKFHHVTQHQNQNQLNIIVRYVY
jgi:hypothetical protein